MVTMVTDMDTTRSNKCRFSLLALTIITTTSFAGEWEVTPGVSLEETYSDNVELTNANQQSSYVHQVSALLNSTYSSRTTEFNFDGRSTYASYTHNHELDDSFRTLNADGRIALWPDGLAATMSAGVRNGATNGARNSLADIVSADTVEIRNFQAGLTYDIDNPDYSLNLTVNTGRQSSEDNIGDNSRIDSILSSESRVANKGVFWRINGFYTDQSNNDITGRRHIIDAIVGWQTPFKVNPFVRIYNEKLSGNISQTQRNSADAVGAGINTRISPRVLLSASYNFVVDDDDNDDYVAASLSWQPSARTLLSAEYSRRFFGDTYRFDLTHTTRRLTNSINYNESLRAFDRSTFQQVLVGNFLCPEDFNTNTDDFSRCFQQSDSVNSQNSQLIQVFEQQLIEGNEFSLNKELNWQSQLRLARTEFDLRVSHNRRESLTSQIIDNRFSANFEITRQISGKSDVSIRYNFNHTQLDKDQVLSLGQDDYYRTLSIGYDRRLARTLSSTISVQMVDRNSSNQLRTYEETRAIITLTKDF